MDIIPQLIVNSIIAGAIYTLVALGFNLIYGTVKFFDLGYGALTAVGGYAVFYLYKTLGAPIYVAVIVGVLVSGLVGYDTGIEPTMGLSLLLKGVIAAIIGGIGNVYGGVLGAFLLGFIENFGIWKISGEWKDAIAFGVLILFLLFRPQGILRR